MGLGIEVVAGRVVNPGAALTAVTADTNNTLTVRDAPDTSAIWLEDIWSQNATGGELRITSPRLHDNLQGIRCQIPAGVIRGAFADEMRHRLYANDPLTVQLSGGGAETDVACLMVYYEDINGISQNLHTWEEIQPRIVEFMGHVVQVTGPTTAGDWSAGNTLNSFSSQQKADESYALLGYENATAVAAIGVQGADTGGLRIGGPGPLEPLETRDWFISLARNTGKPCIPVIKANNFASTLVSEVKATSGGTDSVTLWLARLTK